MDVREKLEVIAHLGDHISYKDDIGFFYDSALAKVIEGAYMELKNGVTVQECGHWKIIMDDYDCEMMCCSVCGSEFYDGDNDTVDCLHNYCPHCGAKMLPQPPKGE